MEKTTNNNESFKLQTKWSLSVNLPDGRPVRVYNINNIPVADGIASIQHDRLCKKIHTELNNVQLDFSCKVDDTSLMEWVRMHYKNTYGKFETYFDFSVDENHPDSVKAVLKLPVNKMTEEEKKEVIDLLQETTDIDLDELKEMLK